MTIRKIVFLGILISFSWIAVTTGLSFLIGGKTKQTVSFIKQGTNPPISPVKSVYYLGERDYLICFEDKKLGANLISIPEYKQSYLDVGKVLSSSAKNVKNCNELSASPVFVKLPKCQRDMKRQININSPCFSQKWEHIVHLDDRNRHPRLAIYQNSPVHNFGKEEILSILNAVVVDIVLVPFAILFGLMMFVVALPRMTW